MRRDEESESMNKVRVIVISLVLGILGSADLSSAQTSVQQKPTASESDQRTREIWVTLGEKTIKAVVADEEQTLLKGLLGWDRITDEKGMLLDFGKPGQYAIHMQGMKFPIDAVWIDAGGIVKLIYEKIQPNSGRIYPSVYSCRYCLEIQSGFCRRFGVKEGDKIKFH